MSAPLVSVLIPTYDYARYLGEAVDSALAQTVDDIEVVIVDNASTDNTPEVAWTKTMADRRVRYVRNAANIGGLANWDRALALARGEYVKYLFADDLLAPHCIETLLEPMLADPGITLAFSHWDRFADDGTAYPPLPYLADRPCVFDGRSLVANALLRVDNFFGCPTEVLFRRADLLGAPLFDRLQHAPVHIDSIADFVVFAELAGRGACFYTPDDLSHLRQHGASWTAAAAGVSRFQIDWPRAFRYLTTQGLGTDRRVARTFVATLTSHISALVASGRPVAPGMGGLLSDLGAILDRAGDAAAVSPGRVWRPVLVVLESSGLDETLDAVAAIGASTHRTLIDLVVVTPDDRRADLAHHIDGPVHLAPAAEHRSGCAEQYAAGIHEVAVVLSDRTAVEPGFAEALLAQARSGLRELVGPVGSTARAIAA